MTSSSLSQVCLSGSEGFDGSPRPSQKAGFVQADRTPAPRTAEELARVLTATEIVMLIGIARDKAADYELEMMKLARTDTTRIVMEDHYAAQSLWMRNGERYELALRLHLEAEDRLMRGDFSDTPGVV